MSKLTSLSILVWYTRDKKILQEKKPCLSSKCSKNSLTFIGFNAYANKISYNPNLILSIQSPWNHLNAYFIGIVLYDKSYCLK